MSLPFVTGQVLTAIDLNALAVSATLQSGSGASLIGYGSTTVKAALDGFTASAVTSVAGRTGAITLSFPDVSGVAALTGDSTQNFNVKNATGSNHAVNLAQADLRYAPFGSSGTGTVTSVGLALPTDFTISGSPVTSAGSLSAAWAAQASAHVLASPTGSSGTPVFRSLAAGDIPTLNQNTTGTAGGLSAILGISLGGTGQATAQAAIDAITQVSGATNEYVLTKDTGTGHALWKVSSGGSSNFIAAGSGAVTRTMQNKARDYVSILDYGGDPTGVADSYPAIALALNALPAEGGSIRFPDGHYRVDTVPNPGTKSFALDISSGCIFSGTGTGSGKFPYMITNGSQLAVGPWIVSQTSQHSTNTNGGVAAFQVEMLQPASYGAGQSVALYAGVQTNNPTPGANIWAINTVMNVGSAVVAGSVAQGYEMDINNDSAGAQVIGLSMSGYSTQAPTAAIEILMNLTRWKRGIDIRNSSVGIQIYTDTVPQGMVIGNPGVITNTAISAQQITTGSDVMFLQRLNSGTSGYFMRCVNESNSQNLFMLRADGLMTCQGTIVGLSGVYTTNLNMTDGATTGPAGYLSLGNTVGTFPATAGGLSLPSNPAAFWAVIFGSTVYKIPMYNS